jgi:cation diffusion facilitator CzcD-associated flavoprotein CzcO
MSSTTMRPSATGPTAIPPALPTRQTTRSRGSSVVVIGAGPYGLSVAAHLQAHGVRARVFGEPMVTWRSHMPAGMFLKSTPAASAIAAPVPGFTLSDFFAASGLPALGDDEPVPIEDFERYGLWFQSSLVPWVEQVRVRRVARDGEAFEVWLDSGEELRAAAVVVATGLVDFAHVPDELAAGLAHQEPGVAAAVSHSSQHRDLSVFAGRRVAVVGAGQSALETAALLHECGARVHVLVRGRRVVFAGPPSGDAPLHRLLKPSSPMGPGWSLAALHRGAPMFRHLPLGARLRTVHNVLGPSGAWWLRSRVEGRIDLRIEHRVRAATIGTDGLVLHLNDANQRSYELPVDHVIAATGYRADLGQMDFLAPSLRNRLTSARGWPGLTPDFESSEPGLFFVGLSAAATFGPLLRFVCGTELAGPRVARASAVHALSEPGA